MARQIKDFNRRMILELAKEYANSSAEFSRSFFCKKEDISQGTFYRILHKAIEEWIVDEETARKIAWKSEQNASQGSESKAGGIQSRHAYEESFRKRDEFDISRSTAKKYAEMYAYSDLLQTPFKISEVMPTPFFNALMKKAIVENIVSDEIVKKLKIKAMRSNNSTIAYNFFEELEEQRREFKENKKTKKQDTDEQKKVQKDYAQMNKENYGIPDEMEEYIDSMKDN